MAEGDLNILIFAGRPLWITPNYTPPGGQQGCIFIAAVSTVINISISNFDEWFSTNISQISPQGPPGSG